MLDSKEICNNGTSLPVTVLGYHKSEELVVKMKDLKISNLVTNQLTPTPVSFYILNVVLKDTLLESVMILLSLILIMKLNLSEFQLKEPSIFTTYHVIMDKMLCSLLVIMNALMKFHLKCYNLEESL